MQIGDRIRAIRREKGLRQDDLASSVGISKQYMCAIENGRGNPSYGVVERIAEVLGYDVRMLRKEVAV